MMRYQQQINLPEVGEAGQLKIKNAKVACVGAGGLGTPLLLYLAASGVGTLGIIDDDKVELSNLHRQILYQDKDIGRSKAECAAEKLSAYESIIHIHPARLKPDNAADLLRQYDIVADCSDNFSTRFLLNDICFQLDKPLVSASIFQFQGQCMTFHGKRGPCLRCLYPDMPDENGILNCDQAGVLNVLPGLCSMIEASEVLKWILSIGELLIGKVLIVDTLKMRFLEYELPKNPDCDLCVNGRMMHDNLRHDSCIKGENMNREYIITSFELNELLRKNSDFQLVDVRTVDKHVAYNIGGKHIPMAELSDRFNELDPEKLVVTYCTSGGNSLRALQLLLSVGFKTVKSLDGGMTAWRELSA